jgi:hypothetical protein
VLTVNVIHNTYPGASHLQIQTIKMIGLSSHLMLKDSKQVPTVHIKKQIQSTTTSSSSSAAAAATTKVQLTATGERSHMMIVENLQVSITESFTLTWN